MDFRDSTQIFALAAGGLFVFLLLRSLLFSRILLYIRRIIVRTYRLVALFVLKHLVYPFFFKRRRFFGPATRWRVILHLAHWAGTAVGASIGTESLLQAGSRAATLSVVHLVPLFLGGHLSFAADMLGLSYNTFRLIHGSLGLTGCVLAFFHVVAVIANDPHIMFQDQVWLWGFVVGIRVNGITFSSKTDLAREAFRLVYYLS